MSLGGGSIGIVRATVSSGERSVYVAVVPCRLFDTRSDNNVGQRLAPLAGGETFTQTMHGPNGNCTIPLDAVGIAMNVTVVNGTAGSFLTIWPADAPRPLASSLNWTPGSPPTPNKVDVKLSTDGKVNLYNNAGSVDVLADIVGYYVDHNHDDRYYTRAQADAALAGKATKPSGTITILLGAAGFVGENHPESILLVEQFGALVGTTDARCVRAELKLPDRATVIAIGASLRDMDGGQGMWVGLRREPIGPTPRTEIGTTALTVGTPGDVTVTDSTINNAVVDNAAASYHLRVCGLTSSGNWLYDATVIYQNP